MNFAGFLLVLDLFLHVVYIDSTKVVSMDLRGELCCILFAFFLEKEKKE